MMSRGKVCTAGHTFVVTIFAIAGALPTDARAFSRKGCHIEVLMTINPVPLISGSMKPSDGVVGCPASSTIVSPGRSALMAA